MYGVLYLSLEGKTHSRSRGLWCMQARDKSNRCSPSLSVPAGPTGCDSSFARRPMGCRSLCDTCLYVAARLVREKIVR